MENGADTPLARLRRQKRITQTALAAQVQCSQRHISSIELGEARPSVDLAIAIADALDTTVTALFASPEGVA